MFPTAAAFVLASLPAAELAPRAAAAKALPLLAHAAAGHAEQKSCFACHNQAFPLLAYRTAAARGLPAPDGFFAAQAGHVSAFLATNRDRFLKGQGTGGGVDTAGYALFTLEQAGHAADENTAAVVEYLLTTQPDRDHWKTASNRPPTEASVFTTTFVAVRGLNKWATAEQKGRAATRVTAARGWLLTAKAADTEDRVFRLLALKEAGAADRDLAAAAWELAKTQRADGGWGQLDALPSDAYATGTALVALHRAGGLPTTHPGYARGVAFLVKTQLADGSWRVKSRSKPFQPYYETGFPHEKDQFVSAAATGWAATALLLATPERR